MQIMDGSECEKSASVEDEASAKNSLPKSSLLSEALLRTKEKISTTNGPTIISPKASPKSSLLSEALLRTNGPTSTAESNGGGGVGGGEEEDAPPTADTVSAPDVKDEDTKDTPIKNEAESEVKNGEGGVVVNGVHNEEAESDEVKEEGEADQSPSEEKKEGGASDLEEEIEEGMEIDAEMDLEPEVEISVEEAATTQLSSEAVAEKRPADDASIDDKSPSAALVDGYSSDNGARKEVENKEEAGLMSDEEDGQSIGSCASQSNQVTEADAGSGSERRFKADRKRRLEANDGASSHGSDSDSATAAHLLGIRAPPSKKSSTTPTPTIDDSSGSVGVEEDAREKLVREYLEQSAMSIDDMNMSADKLQREISALGELARAKELEWNSILRLRKLKEEMLERLLRKRRQYFISSGSAANDWADSAAATAASIAALPSVSVTNSISSVVSSNERDLKKMKRPSLQASLSKGGGNSTVSSGESGNSNFTMVPIISSSPSTVHHNQHHMNGGGSCTVTSGSGDKPINFSTSSSSSSSGLVRSSSNPSSNSNITFSKLQRPLLPKPPGMSPSDRALLDLQNSVIGEGRQGTILDVKSIIADYRSRHPETIPRRGRRPVGAPATSTGGGGGGGGGGSSGGGQTNPKVECSMVSSTRFSGSPALMSMANLALGSGSHVRTVASAQDFPNNFIGHDLSRPSSADSLKNSDLTSSLVQSTNNVSFKDFLVHFAKMKQENLSSQSSSPQINSNKPSSQPPPYPEVTLHPVAAPPSPPQSQTSLLHGILTKSNSQAKNNANSQHRPTAFSPTLARLLTAPEKSSRTMRFQESAGAPQFRPPVNNKTISDIFTPCKKSRNEITITPVSTISPIQKSKDEVVLLDDEEDASDRLVIDEGASEPVAEVPECQGCHQRSAQFVCAGCGNQWYCSRECQVEAWEEHSEMCSEH